MRRLHMTMLFMAGLMLELSGQSWAAVESPEALDAARQDAMALIQSGQRLDAERLLLDVLSTIPRDRADLAMPAIGAVQLFLFNHECLMTDAERLTFYEGALDEEGNEMHKLLATLMRYMVDAPMSQEESNACARDLQSLTQCEHLPVRMGALFTMSSPYYFYDTKLAQQARDQIAEEFPGTYLAQEAQRLSLYHAREGGAAGLRDVLERKTDEGHLRAHSERMQIDQVGKVIQEATTRAADGNADEACVEALAATLQDAVDWAEEYSALSILEGFHETPSAGQVRAAANGVIAGNNDARCVFRARMLRMSIARIQGDVETALEDANALLDLEPLPFVPARNYYEDLRNSILQTSDFLVGSGRGGEARQLLERLAARFPGSMLARRIQNKLSAPALDQPAQ